MSAEATPEGDRVGGRVEHRLLLKMLVVPSLTDLVIMLKSIRAVFASSGAY